MKIENLFENPEGVRAYAERFINDGSPSGFSTINTTSEETSPFGITEWFNPFICLGPKQFFKAYGEIPNLVDSKESDDWIIVHPDMVKKKIFKDKRFDLKKAKHIRVVPTASGRTVQVINDKNNDYLKLHYQGILGRITREIPYDKAIAGPELSIILEKAIRNKVLEKELSIFPEKGAKVLQKKSMIGIEEWGMVYRKNEVFGDLEERTFIVLPIFSLFSMDRNNKKHHPLLKQIIDFKNIDSEKYVFEALIEPLVRCYFDLILKLGLQPEWNSQNLLVGFDNNLNVIKLIMRDLESIDKDLTVMEEFNIEHDFQCYPYKCIFRGQYNYTIKHSFMYDFKLGESILAPIGDILIRYFDYDLEKFNSKVKEISKKYIQLLPNEFFPKNKWYVFDKVLVDKNKPDRPYIEFDNPKFRFK